MCSLSMLGLINLPICWQFGEFAAVCEHAYSLAQNLDPNSEGRGVLQFKTGLMSVIKVCV